MSTVTEQLLSNEFIAKLEKGKDYQELAWLKPMVQFRGLPRGFIPSQDMGYLLVNIQLPDSASVERTQAVIRKIEVAIEKIGGGGLSPPVNPLLTSPWYRRTVSS